MTIEFFAESNIATQTLPRSVAAKAGGFVFISGQVGRDEAGVIVSGGVAAQTRQTMSNVVHALAMSGCTLDDVVKVTVWLHDPADFAEFNQAYGEFFPGKRPARSTMQGTNMAGTAVEIEAIAFKP